MQSCGCSDTHQFMLIKGPVDRGFCKYISSITRQKVKDSGYVFIADHPDDYIQPSVWHRCKLPAHPPDAAHIVSCIADDKRRMRQDLPPPAKSGRLDDMGKAPADGPVRDIISILP